MKDNSLTLNPMSARLARLWQTLIQHQTALIYLASITAAELLTTFYSVQVGVAAHSMVLVALILHASLVPDRPVHRLLLALSLAPLVRILSLAMPLWPFARIYWYIIIAAPLFAASFMVIRNLGLGRRELGLTFNKVPLQAVIALTGIPFGFMEYLILKPQSLIAQLTFDQIWLPAVILLIGTGFLEELIFRGLLQRVSLGILGGTRGLIYVSLLFAALHIGYKSGWDLLFVFAIAVFFSWVAKRTGSILGVTLSHGLTNIFLYLVAPFL
ncbi:MAG: CPBP family intramembrane metalloprotease [Chloroflexi bacterium]|nr:CPBP family intramembrane metalloprotease [Chloroflexota bacterium]